MMLREDVRTVRSSQEKRDAGVGDGGDAGGRALEDVAVEEFKT